MRHRTLRTAAIAAAVGLLAAACGSDDDSADTAEAASTAAPTTSVSDTAAATTDTTMASTESTGASADSTEAPTEGSAVALAEPASVSVRLNVPSWGSYHAGMAIAETMGWYEEAGIDTNFGTGTGSLPTAQQVASGTDDIAFTSADAVSRVDALDGDLKMFANLAPDAGNCLMVKADSGIASPADMTGKTIGDAAGFVTLQVMPALWGAVGVDPGSVNVITVDPASRMQGWLSGQYEGLPSFIFGEPVQAEMQFDQANECFMLSDYGIQLVGFGLVAKSSFIEEHPDVVAVFADVTLRGYEYAYEHPDEAAAAIRELGEDAPTLPPDELVIAALEQFKDRALVDASLGQPYGYNSPERWASMIETMQAYADLDPAVVPTDLYTNVLFE